MNTIQKAIAHVLCEVEKLKNNIKNIIIYLNNILITNNLKSINFTGGVEVTNSNGDITVNILGGASNQQSRTINICSSLLSGNGTEIEQIVEYLNLMEFTREEQDSDILIYIISCGYSGSGSEGIGIGISLL